MKKLFEDMFKKQPDEIIGDDYYYSVPWHNAPRNAVTRDGVTSDGEKINYTEQNEKRENAIKQYFTYHWELNSFENQSGPVRNAELNDTEAVEIISKIAREDKTFMDIASSDSMGLASYILKINPYKPCLVTDLDVLGMKCLRSCINEHLPNYDISIASFDNFDMPLKDCSLDYVTSLRGLSSSVRNPADGLGFNIFQHSAYKEKAIGEIYRVLKPGGCFVGLEMDMEFKYDLKDIHEHCERYGKLFGVYTYDEIKGALAFLAEEDWSEKFISAGFTVECEKKHYSDSGMLRGFLRHTTDREKIREWTDEEEILSELPWYAVERLKTKLTVEEMLSDEDLIEYINTYMRNLTMIKNGFRRQLTTDEITDIFRIIEQSDLIQKHINESSLKSYDADINFYHVNSFYVLRKPMI